jgi:PAS domain S-box-containing protein
MVAIRTGAPQQNVMMGVHKPNGELTWILVNSQLLYYPDSKMPYAVFSLFHDVTHRKQVENELSKTLERLHLIGDNFPDGSISLISKDLVFLYTGGSDYQKFNVNPKKLIGTSIQESLIPEIYEPIKKLLPSVFAGHQESFEVQFKEVYYIGTIKPIVNQDGTVENFILLASNMTERKKMEKDLRRTKEMLEQTNQIARVGGWEINANSLEVTWSNTVAEILETDNLTPQLQEIFELYKKAHFRKIVEQSVEKALKEGKSFDLEVQINTYKDNEIWLRIVGVTEQDKEGKVKRVYGALTDITAYKKAQEELARLSMVAEKTSNAVIITDSHKNIIWVNDAFTKITGYTSEEVIGKTPKMFHFEGTDLKVIEQVNQKLALQQEFRFEILNKGKTGRVYWLDIEIQPMLDKAGNLQGYIAIETDITDRKEVQQERENFVEIVQHQNQRLREYTHITSHNLRAPVANLKGLLQLLKTEPNNDIYQKMIETSVCRLDDTLHIMNDLLDIENQSSSIPKTWLNVKEIVVKNCEVLQNIINEPVKFIYHIPDELEVKAIPVYLDSILNNLISNAIKYHKNYETAVVEITAFHQEKFTFIQVKDNGIGIDLAKYQDKLFKLKSRLTQNVEGKGVGLFFTKHQAEAMGGNITVESQLGIGTTFILSLPNS